MFCINCGQKLPDGAKFCISCGTKMVEVSSQSSIGASPTERCQEDSKRNPVLTFEILGNRLEYDSSMVEYTEMRKSYYADAMQYLLNEQKKTMEIRNDEENPDSTIDLFSSFGQDTVRYAFNLAHQFLIKSGVYNVSQKQLIDYAANDATMFYDEYRKLEEEYLEIVASEEELKEYRRMVNSNPGPWRGGGFGVSGAMKGAMTAGALNIGSNMIRSISGAISDSFERSALRKKKIQLLRCKNWISHFTMSICYDINTIFFKTYELLSQNTDITMPQINREQAITYFQNSKGIGDANLAVKMCTMSIQEDPFYPLPYGLLLKYPNVLLLNDLARVVDYFSVYHEKMVLAGNFFRYIDAGLNKANDGKKKYLAEQYISLFKNNANDSEFIKILSDKNLQSFEKYHEKISIQERTAEDGTILPSLAALEVYQGEIERFNQYVERVEKEDSLLAQISIWEEAWFEEFSSEELVSRIEDALLIIEKKIKLLVFLERLRKQSEYEEKVYKEYENLSLTLDDPYEKLETWKRAKSETIFSEKIIKKIDNQIKKIEQALCARDNLIIQNLQGYLEAAKKCSTPLETLSLWRVIQLEIGDNPAPQVHDAISNYIKEAIKNYSGIEPSISFDGRKEISREELIGIFSMIVRKYRHYKHSWPVHVIGSNKYTQKISNAYKAIGGNRSDEFCLLIVDATVFESCKKGYVITDRGMYKNMPTGGRYSVLWGNTLGFEVEGANLLVAEVEEDGKRNDTIIDNNYIASNIEAICYLLQTSLEIMRAYKLKG